MEEQSIVELMVALKYALRQYKYESDILGLDKSIKAEAVEAVIHWEKITNKLRTLIEVKVEQIVADK